MTGLAVPASMLEGIACLDHALPDAATESGGPKGADNKIDVRNYGLR